MLALQREHDTLSEQLKAHASSDKVVGRPWFFAEIVESSTASDADWRYAVTFRWIVMRIFFSNLVAVSLLLHALMGCCWHQDDTLQAGCGHLASGEIKGDCHHHDECCDEETGGPSSESPCDGHSHCHGVCTYLPVQKTQLDGGLLDAPLDFAVCLSAMCDAHVSMSFALVADHDTVAGPPVRLHLFHQLLLI
jgi:hypothetical protein